MANNLDSKRIVLVGVEEAQATEAYEASFLSYAQNLASRGLLKRIFFDESHVVLTSQDYRYKMIDLMVLRTLPVPFILLTATLPPTMQTELEEAMLVPKAKYIRAATYRKNIELSVRVQGNGKSVTAAIQLVKANETSFHAGQRGIVYCRDRRIAERLSGMLSVPVYHAGMDPEPRKLAVRRWLELESGFIVATTALGAGIEIPGLILVIHLNLPYGAIDFVQESGRAGRQGEDSKAIILLDERELHQRTKLGGFRGTNEQVLMDTVSDAKSCRRLRLSEYIDGVAQSCQQISGLPCDVCRSQEPAWTREPVEQGTQLYHRAVKARSQGMEGLKALVADVSYHDGKWGLCPVCYVLSGEDKAEHSFMHCSEHPGLGWDDYKSFGGLIRWPRDYSICIRCAVWHQECESGSKNKNCKWMHAVVPLAMALRHQMAGQRLIREISGGWDGFWDDREYAQWLSRGYFKAVYGIRMLNIHRLIAGMVEERELV